MKHSHYKFCWGAWGLWFWKALYFNHSRWKAYSWYNHCVNISLRIWLIGSIPSNERRSFIISLFYHKKDKQNALKPLLSSWLFVIKVLNLFIFIRIITAIHFSPHCLVDYTQYVHTQNPYSKPSNLLLDCWHWPG